MNISKLPFFFKSHPDKNNGGFPQSLPFNLYYDDELRMFRQKATTQLGALLNEVYKEGSLVEGSVSSESGHVYVDKIVSYIENNFNFNDNSKVLEVGFGSGVILRELKKKGIKFLVGVEPGCHQYVEGLDGIKLVNDFFPSQQITEKFDLIYTMLVLEHIEEPVSYLRELISSLNEGGKLIFAVPNCEPYLMEGDLSIFIHEHYSYFTRESIIQTVLRTDFKIEDITIIEGAFIVTVSGEGKNIQSLEKGMFKDYFNKRVDKHISSLVNIFNNYVSKDIAVYSPTRAINSLFVTERFDVRLVDDNSEMRGKFLPSLTSPIESFEDLVMNPPKLILIFSRTFGMRIKQKCLANPRLGGVRLLTLNDLDNTI